MEEHTLNILKNPIERYNHCRDISPLLKINFNIERFVNTWIDKFKEEFKLIKLRTQRFISYDIDKIFVDELLRNYDEKYNINNLFRQKMLDYKLNKHKYFL